jgi:hypothetical protein
MLSRRSLIAAPIGLAACASTSPGAAGGPERRFLDRVIEAAGGEDALNRARVLAWTGQATVRAGERTLTIGVNTIVQPFQYARSETWLLSEGRASTRVLEIDGDRGWAIRDGARTPLPPAQTEHERQQYALYGLMRFVSLRDRDVRMSVYGDDEPFSVAGPVLADTRYALSVEHPAAPRTRFLFDANHRLIGASNTVTSPEGGGQPIEQLFRFFDTIEGNGVNWPRRMSIRQGASASDFFELTLDTFTPRQHR